MKVKTQLNLLVRL